MKRRYARVLTSAFIDSTYELFAIFHGLHRFTEQDRPWGAVLGGRDAYCL